MKKENKLINEKSPYLLQHAYNPINWYGWALEAFETAKLEDKPIFVSIGYSTCHWCHVMAHESFEDEEVSNFLNKNFISIKVDREERPDVDSIYMSVCQALTGHGGWPLTVFIDADKKPFFAGTYFPKKEFMNLLKRITFIWENERNNLINQADKIIDHISDENRLSEEIDVDIAHTAFNQLQNKYDEKYGGFSNAPKFPTPHNLLFLNHYYHITDNQEALRMFTETLIHLRKGGIYDHIGYGFSRYSTDKKWLVPHFEKMLYDNALLIIANIEAYKTTKNDMFLETSEQIIEYLLRDMKHEDGGFYTAEDADSEGEEGLFYVFTKKEIDQILEEDSPLFCHYFNITEKGNFEGKNIPNLIGNSILDNDKQIIEKCRKKIFNYQMKRIRPGRDDKILTSYNGLTIAALSRAFTVTKKDKYLKIAKETVEFIKKYLYKDSKLLARYRDKEAKYLGYAEDYGYLIFGLIELYQASFDKEYLDFAIELNEIVLSNFYDDDNGGFYLNDKDSETIIYRKKEVYDGATPSANALIINNLYRLSSLLHNENYYYIANKSLKQFINEIKRYPLGYTFSSINILYYFYGSLDIVLTAKKQEDLKEFIDVIYEKNKPNINIVIELNNQEYQAINNKPTAYICKGKACLPPINDIEILEETL